MWPNGGGSPPPGQPNKGGLPNGGVIKSTSKGLGWLRQPSFGHKGLAEPSLWAEPPPGRRNRDDRATPWPNGGGQSYQILGGFGPPHLGTWGWLNNPHWP
jgi:hypothetical protein